MNLYAIKYKFNLRGYTLDATQVAENEYQAERLAKERLEKKHKGFMGENEIDRIDILKVTLIGGINYVDIAEDKTLSLQELGEIPSYRDDMDAEQEKRFVAHLYSRYEKSGFSKLFWSNGGDFPEYIGKPFKVVGRADENKADLSDLPMWEIEFEDGETINAHPDEVILEVVNHPTAKAGGL